MTFQGLRFLQCSYSASFLSTELSSPEKFKQYPCDIMISLRFQSAHKMVVFSKHLQEECPSRLLHTHIHIYTYTYMHTYICVCMHIHYTQLFLELSTYQFVALQFKNTFFQHTSGKRQRGISHRMFYSQVWKYITFPLVQWKYITFELSHMIDLTKTQNQTIALF